MRSFLMQLAEGRRVFPDVSMEEIPPESI